MKNEALNRPQENTSEVTRREDSDAVNPLKAIEHNSSDSEPDVRAMIRTAKMESELFEIYRQCGIIVEKRIEGEEIVMTIRYPHSIF